MKKNFRKSNLSFLKSQLKTKETKLVDNVLVFTGPLTVGELALKLDKKANNIIGYFLTQNKIYNLNYTLNEEEIAEVCLHYNFEFAKEKSISLENLAASLNVDDSEIELQTRPPVIVVMGHVDHGKTTLIDQIRKSNIVASEAGKITQHTGAYQISYQQKLITFLDTPGHEAFSQMRLRGSQITDIAIIVVSADEAVKSQTLEAINHAKIANLPIIVFVNKMDKPGADPEKVKQQLAEHDVLCEEWGGKVPFVYGSALKNKNVDELLENILLLAEILQLKANPNRMPIGVVVESKIDRGKGPVVTLIVQKGTLMKGDFVVAGSFFGKVRTLETPEGKILQQAKPGTPCKITGLNATPKAGQSFIGIEDEKYAKKIADEKLFLDKQNDLKNRASLAYEGDKKIFNIILKSDTHGTNEALKNTLMFLENDEVKVNLVYNAVGEINKSDLLLAQTAKANIYAFNLKIPAEIKSYAKAHKIKIKNFDVIYQIIDEVKKIIQTMKEPVYEEKITGKALILKIFYYSKVGNIAGCTMVEGMAKFPSKVRVKRKQKVIFEGDLFSLRKGKEDVKKVDKGFEFGTSIVKFNDILVDDELEFYEQVLVENV